MKLVTVQQMRDLEQAAVAAGTSLDALMENAGLAVAQEAWMQLGVVADRRILVLVGPGNNGGDGLVAARHLADWEADVAVYLLRARSGDAKLSALEQRNVPVFVAGDDAGFTRLQEALDGAEMVIDALLGTGRARPIDGLMAEVLRRLRHAQQRRTPPKVLAVDLPTGVDADTGAADELAVRADLTVTLGLAKVGLYTLPAAEHAGRVEVVDIGLPKQAADAVPTELLTSSWVRDRLPSRPKGSNKGTFGKVLVVAGSELYVGAARLAAEGAYRSGAGLVTLACSPRLQAMIAPALPEVTYLPIADEGGALPASAAEELAQHLATYGVLLIGPGLSQRGTVRTLVGRLLEAAPERLRGAVADGDALNALAATPGWHERVRVPVVLTPHPGEMARLCDASVADVQANRLRIALDYASASGHVTVLKGAHTVVASPDGRAAVSPYANPLLAVAGTGDVLAGAIAGLLAQGAAPFEAAACGVFAHAMAAETLAETLGDRGLLASDLLPELPRTLQVIVHGRPARALAPAPFGGLGDLASLAGLGGGMPPE